MQGYVIPKTAISNDLMECTTVHNVRTEFRTDVSEENLILGNRQVTGI